MSAKASAALTLRQFQSETDAIREAPISNGPRVGIWLLTGMIVSTLILTMIVPVDRTVTSENGSIVSTEAINVFQALDPSVIKSIDVKEGQTVAGGQMLATLDPTFASADVSQLRLQLAGLNAQIERAGAELAERVPDFSGMMNAEVRPYAEIQNALYLQRTSQYRAQIASFVDKISQTQATIVKYQNDESRYAEREAISKQVEDMRQILAEHQVGSKLNLLSATDQRLEMLRTMENEHNGLLESRHQLASLQQDEEAFKQQWAATLSQELVTARNTRDQVEASLSKATRHKDLVVLRAPEDGVVLTMAKLSVGSVLREGDTLMTLMPTRTRLEAEAHVSSRDIGFLRKNDKVTLKIDAFNSSEHGTASGHVNWISEGAFTADDDGKPTLAFYKVRVAIDAYHFTGVPPNFRLIPGMTLTADINVGSRSLAKYLIGGALRGAGESMRSP